MRESRDRATCRKPACNWYRCQKRNGKGVQCSAYLGIYVGEPSKFHTYERVTTRRMGTCTKEGWQVEYCKYCTNHRTVTLPKHHAYTNQYRNNKAERYCSRCKQWISLFTSN